eukprot:Gregarina_sp_Poly_1__2330@NODE_1621_length_3693_cov_115_410645_g1068_i0_p2_GENE_NODE_1621_length_3693_cov_115_410645_g1068_i0NODE_1621_length_3693_cov_115_410645_g1068_i0_p2_ORF_typecomplete_len274_score16_10Rhomboid/PF01694_22/1e03Rhomboid/PF01694_22/1e31Rhomboid/PF01694_22/1_1e04DER1/PF04511_15/0_00013DUF1751/PF08551_10/6e02DUF1751/PF08551_10/0_00028DUF1751/PF08551_10/3_4e03DUF1751/PF08551_10/2_8e03GNVR/PF13807_6/5e02GNVR/PF13807_6/7_9_NODE_1621_length_3693_cov_115_410645_g1068_i015342355
MANVHTLSDYQRSYSRPQQQNSLSIPVETYGERPRCIDLFLPGFRWKSFIVVISICQVIVYIVSLAIGSYALVPNSATLSKFGASYGPALANGEIWRLVTPLFLHASIWHILFNVFFQMRMGLGSEKQYGQYILAAVYLICGVCGNLFSMALAPCKVAVGASTAGFGLIGLQLSEIALTWHTLQSKDQVIFNITLFVLMSVLISIGPHSVVDWRGHLGGLIGGLCLGVLLNERMTEKPLWYKTGKTVAAATITGLVISTLCVIYLIPMSARGC